MSRKLKFTVGQRVWLFDINRRVYPKPEGGSKYVGGGPIYAEHFEPRYVVAIEPRVYLLSLEQNNAAHAKRVSYTKAEGKYVTDAEKDEKVYCHDNAYLISKAVESADAPTLKKIADLIGYVPPKQVPQ